MIREQGKEQFRSDVDRGMSPMIAAYPIVARGVFGPSPGEVLDKTEGKVWHFYYIYLLVQYILFPLWLWLGPENSDPPIRDFMIGYLGYEQGNWFFGYSLLWFCGEVGLAVFLRVLLYPVGPDGRADWRWNK
jgi:hypothetical protein